MLGFEKIEFLSIQQKDDTNWRVNTACMSTLRYSSSSTTVLTTVWIDLSVITPNNK